MTLTDIDNADRLSRRRARMFPALAAIFIVQQATYFAEPDAATRLVDHVKIGAWLLLSVVLVLARATGGFWFKPKPVRMLMDDDITRANRADAFRFGFLATMAAAILLYFLLLFEPIGGREAIHALTTIGIATAIVAIVVAFQVLNGVIIIARGLANTLFALNLVFQLMRMGVAYLSAGLAVLADEAGERVGGLVGKQLIEGFNGDGHPSRSLAVEGNGGRHDRTPASREPKAPARRVPMVAFGGVSGMDAASKPPGTDSRRPRKRAVTPCPPTMVERSARRPKRQSISEA